mmetsp:Transcript_99390/g.290122  ORF Transcript_99390/g.290122 Transcript_99390/m.290122 type:complete len:159 (-) Transcript_99390:192-668(-)
MVPIMLIATLFLGHLAMSSRDEDQDILAAASFLLVMPPDMCKEATEKADETAKAAQQADRNFDTAKKQRDDKEKVLGQRTRAAEAAKKNADEHRTDPDIRAKNDKAQAEAQAAVTTATEAFETAKKNFEDANKNKKSAASAVKIANMDKEADCKKGKK